MSKLIKTLLILSILFSVCFISFSYATEIDESIDENLTSDESLSTDEDLEEDLTSDSTITSVSQLSNYSEANLELNNILNIILIAIGVLIVLFAIAILIRLKQ